MAEINTPVLRNVFKRSSIDEQILSLRKNSIFARKSSINARKVLARKTLVSAKAQQTEKRINFLFETKNRRRRREELIEANSTKSGYISGAVKNALSRGKGFMGKIMDSLGFLLLGWLVNQLPRILAFIDTLKFRIINIIDAGKSMIRNIGNIINGIGGVVSQATQNIMDFNFQDFNDPNGEFQSKIKELDKNLQDLGNDFEDAKVNVLNITNPPTEEERKQKEEQPGKATRPEESKEYYGPGGSPSGSGQGQAQQRPETQITPTPSASGTPGAGQTKEMRALLNVIAYAEGTSGEPNYGYNTHYAYDQTADLSAHPNIIKRGGGRNSAAFGRYQFMPRTWIGIGGACKAGGPIPYTPGMSMSPANQDKGAIILAKRRGVTQALLQKEGFSMNVSARLSGEWASIPNAQGQSAYGQPVRKYNQLKALYEKEVGKPKPQVQAPPPKPAPAPPVQPKPQQQSQTTAPSSLMPVSGTTGSTQAPQGKGSKVSMATSPFRRGSGAVITSGMGERWGRMHKGVDIGANRGTPLHSYLPGKIYQTGKLGAANDGGYGNWVTWKDDKFNAYHFFGHMNTQSPLGPGRKFNAGAMLGTVGGSGYGNPNKFEDHLHWEISKNQPDAMGNFKPPTDPITWINNNMVQGVAAAPKSTVTQSRAKGTTIAMVPVPIETEVQVPVSSGGGTGFSKSSGTDPLNSIRNITTMYT